ncbi:MAG: DUF86 domain-containing protein [Thermodesulfobacteriota bacterium]
MSPSPPEYLHHVLDEIDYILTHLPDSFDSFSNDPTRQRAFVRSLEIIGEAAKKLPDDLKAQHPDIEWRKVTGLRDRLIHGYFGVDYTIVWDVITAKLPDLREKIQSLLDSFENRR